MIFSWLQVTATTETGSMASQGPENVVDGDVGTYWGGDFDVGAVAENLARFRWEFGWLNFEESVPGSRYECISSRHDGLCLNAYILIS